MNGVENSGIPQPSITKSSKILNGLDIGAVIQGMREVSALDRKISEKEIEQANKQPKEEKTPVPTAKEIREAYQDGMYR